MSAGRIETLTRKIEALEAELTLDPASARNLGIARSMLVFAQLKMSAGRDREGRELVASAENMVSRAILVAVAPDALRGNKVHRGARDGHEATHGTAQEKQERQERTRQVLAELRQRNPALSLTEARKKAAAALGISYATARRHTPQ